MNRKAMALLTIVLLALALPAIADDGGAVFKAKCAMCHGADGSGNTTMGKNLKLRPLGSADVQKQTDAQLTTIVTDGKGKMPSYKGKLTPAEIAAQIAFIRTLKK